MSKKIYVTGALEMVENKGYITNTDEHGSVNISEEVVAVIAATAAAEVEGVHGLFASHGKEFAQMLTKKGLLRGVKISTEGEVRIDVYVMAEMGYSVSEVGAEVQRSVKSAVEAAAGLTVNTVNVHICGISLKKNK